MTRSKEQMIDLFEKLPNEEQWRFFIDGYRQREGESAFDVRELGYMAAMKRAFKDMMDSIDEPLTAELIIKLHKSALTGVEDTDNENLETFRNKSPGDFGLVCNNDPQNPRMGNVSLQGITEFVNSGALDETLVGIDRKAKPKFEITVNDKDIARTQNPAQIFNLIRSHGGRFYCRHESAESIQKTVNHILSRYHQEILNAKTNESKLNAIITMVAELERRHIFTDGNARTLVMLILNRELVKNGFSPTILDNPNRFDLFSLNELKKEVSVGMQMFWYHASKGKMWKLLQEEQNNEEDEAQRLTL